MMSIKLLVIFSILQMEDCSLEVKGEVQQIFKVLTKEEHDKMPFEGIEIAKTLSRIPFFKRYFDNNSEHFINLCIAQDAIICQPGTNVYHKQQTEGRERYLYVILEGIVEIVTQKNKIKQKGVLRVFGQTELVFGLDKRQEQIVCLTQCKFMRIKQHNMLKIFGHKDSLIKCLHFLKVNPYFDQLNELQKMQLTLGLSRKGFDRGQVLKSQGDGLQNVWFFVYGKAQVSTKLNIEKEREFVIQYLQEMSIFGQYECVSGIPTSIKVRGIVAGAYYYMNFSQMKREQHIICQIIQERSAPYPCSEQLIFLQGVKSTLKTEQKRVVKNCRLFS